MAKGQCDLSMKDKTEAVERHSKLEQNDDTVGPLKMTKELLCMSTEVRHQHWSVTTMLNELVNARQGDNGTMAVHHK